MMANSYERKLKRPFPETALSWRKGPGGSKELVYINARDVMQRLDEVFGVDGWSDTYEYIGDRMICKLSCNFGGTWVTKCDGADDTKIEGAKGGISDALKRAGVKFGIGRYLYVPSAFNSQRKPSAWATQEGYDKIMDEREKSSLEKFRDGLGS